MRKIGCALGLIFSMLGAWAQVGEVNTEEVVIEKNKEIVLPRADKLFSPVNIPDLVRDSIRLNFNIGAPRFNISPYTPMLQPYSFRSPSSTLPYQNFVKLGFGNYGSPVFTGFVGQEINQFNWGLWAHHESFASGSVRGKESGSSASYMDLFGTIKSTKWAVTPAIGWQSDGYRFYGYAPTDDRINTDKTTLGRIRLSATLEEIQENDWTVVIDPVFHSTTQNTPNGQPSSSENYFDFQAQTVYRFDSVFQAGLDLQLGAISFHSENKINRNFTRIQPWVGFRQSKFLVKAGVELATTNDTIVSGTSGFFYPSLSAEWSGIPGWTVYGSLKGALNPVTFSSLTMQNYFLDDSLTITHESIKTSFSGGIRGAIQSRLFLNTGISISSVENMSFFVPSTYDSARFIMAVETEPITVFNWHSSINYQSSASTFLGLSVDVYTYAIKELDYPWYKPSLKLSLDWYQQYGAKFSTMAVLTSLAGLRAPSPDDQGDYTRVNLSSILDLSLQGNYKITERAEAFVQMQNLFGQPYEQFLNYPNRGITFRLGGVYRF